MRKQKKRAGDDEAKPEKRKAGRPPGGGFHPSDDQRKAVEMMAGLGIPEDRMVIAVTNPQTKQGISPVTLRKHFRAELDRGALKAEMKIGTNLLKLSETAPAVAIFLGKVRLHMKESKTIEIVTPVSDLEEQDIDARIKRLLEKGRGKQPDGKRGQS